MLKIDPLDAHDRLNHFTHQSFSISECCQDLVNKTPFGNRAFYIFSHARTIDLDERIAMFNEDLYTSYADPSYVRKYNTLEDVPEKKIVWQPRLTKPKAQTNSMLFKAFPPSDIINIIWMIPARELWKQFEKGKLTENKTIYDSIHAFQNDRIELEKPDDDDPTDEQINMIYRDICQQVKYDKMMEKIYKR
jgi:hypothetical protein